MAKAFFLHLKTQLRTALAGASKEPDARLAKHDLQMPPEDQAVDLQRNVPWRGLRMASRGAGSASAGAAVCGLFSIRVELDERALYSHGDPAAQRQGARRRRRSLLFIYQLRVCARCHMEGEAIRAALLPSKKACCAFSPLLRRVSHKFGIINLMKTKNAHSVLAITCCSPSSASSHLLFWPLPLPSHTTQLSSN